MKTIRLLDLGLVAPVRSQTVYHTIAYALKQESPDTIIMVGPSEPYVCIGYHQELQKEVDVEYCKSHELPVYRREVGGGAVFLDSGQVFTQWVFHPGVLPVDLTARFALYMKPLVETYREFSIEAYIRPINDIHVAGKKIGGTGAARIGDADVVVGSLMFTFDKKTMSKVLKVSSEKMRDKVFESLEQYMTTMQQELGKAPDREAVKSIYIQKCSEALGAKVVEGEWTPAEEALATELDEKFTSAEFIGQKGGLNQHGIKIHEDVRLMEYAYKASGGLIRSTYRSNNGRIDEISISGDFTMFPRHAVVEIEKSLRGKNLTMESVKAEVRRVYRDLKVQSPGVEPEDLVKAIIPH